MGLKSGPQMPGKSKSEREGKVMVCAWLEMELVAEIDQRVAERQVGNPSKVHRSDVIKEVLHDWKARRHKDHQVG